MNARMWTRRLLAGGAVIVTVGAGATGALATNHNTDDRRSTDRLTRERLKEAEERVKDARSITGDPGGDRKTDTTKGKDGKGDKGTTPTTHPDGKISAEGTAGPGEEVHSGPDKAKHAVEAEDGDDTEVAPVATPVMAEARFTG